MAKIFGLNGVVTGKQGNNVFAVRNGEQILRQYQPVVHNPNTGAQVEVRAKMKMLSQLSAVMASAIAIPREGVKSPRNIFTSINYSAATFNNGQAGITLTSIKLTKSVVSLSPLIVSRNGSNISVNIGGIPTQSPFSDFSRVEYWAFTKQSDGTLRLAQKASSSTVEGGFPVTMDIRSNNEAVVYAYGVRFNNEDAAVRYGDVTVTPAETIAKLITSRSLLESDVTLTETKAEVVPAPTQNSAPTQDSETRKKSEKI